MIDRETIDQLTQRISQVLSRAGEYGDDARKKIRNLLEKSFEELNLLTQEEFESRMQALTRAEARIAVLEEQLQALEQRLQSEESTRGPAAAPADAD